MNYNRGAAPLWALRLRKKKALAALGTIQQYPPLLNLRSIEKIQAAVPARGLCRDSLQDELRALSDNYKRIAGFHRETLDRKP